MSVADMQEPGARSRLSGRLSWAALGALSIAFHLGLIFSGLVPNLISRPLHMALALPWVFLYAVKGRLAFATGDRYRPRLQGPVRRVGPVMVAQAHRNGVHSRWRVACSKSRKAGMQNAGPPRYP